MKSAFGVEHGEISKATKKPLIHPDARLPQVAGNVVPAVTVRAFDNSSKHKPEAAGLNIGAKTAGSAVGLAAGGALGALALRKIPGISRDAKLAPKLLSGAHKKTAVRYVTATGGGAVGSTLASQASISHIQRSKRYGYKDRRTV